MTRWVGQEHTHGCQVAVCAMLLGITYAEAATLYPRPPDNERGFIDLYLDNILVEHGYAIARKWRHNAAAGGDRTPWPPAPWADVHWCDVVLPAGGHAIVMLGDGTVLDPATPQPRRLTDYEKVTMVAAIVPLATRR